MTKRAHYYEAHDAEYAKRLAAGQVAWDAGDYDQFFMRAFVERSLERAGFRGAGRRALELGCGTGPLSCQLAEAGFDVTGIDVSPTAIGLAREMSARRGLQINFELGDVCRQALPERSFDLIVDGHLLHCIVFPHERRRLLEQVRNALRQGGEFWVETMLLEGGHEADPAWHLDERGVAWAPIGNDRATHYVEAEWRDGAWWLPQRLIARSPEALMTELGAAGLTVLEWECYPPAEPRTPGGVRARCARDDSAYDVRL
jgi:SAM-dependent methyltransferase